MSVKYLGERMNRVVSNVKEAIGSVHDLSRISTLRITQGWSNRIMGRYMPATNPTKDRIHISQWARQEHLTLLHEIGHYIDARLIGEPNTCYSYHWQEFIERAKSTESYKYSYNASSNKKWFADPCEIFADAYVQYIMQKSQKEPLVSEFGKLSREMLLPLCAHIAHQWTEDEFKALSAMIDELFIAENLITTK